MLKNQSLLIAILFAILLGCAGYFVYPAMAVGLLPDMPRVQYTISAPGPFLFDALGFGLACSLVPLLLHFTWRFSPTGRKGKTLSALIVLLMGCTAFFIHYYKVWNTIAKASAFNQENEKEIVSTFNLSDLMYPVYLITGLLMGTAVAFIVLRKRKARMT